MAFADGDYDIDIYVLVGHSGASYTLTPVGWGATAQSGTCANFTTGLTSTAAGATWPIGTGIGGSTIMHGTLQTLSGLVRGLQLAGWTGPAGASSALIGGESDDGTNTLTNLTGLTVTGNFSDAISPKSYIRARARGVS